MMFFPNVKGNTSCNQLMLILDWGGKEFFYKTSSGHLFIFFLDVGRNASGSNLMFLLICPKKKNKKN
jgi:hypothetical protein